MQNDRNSDLYILKAVYVPVVIITVFIPFVKQIFGPPGHKG